MAQLLCLLYGTPYDLQWLLQSKIYQTFIIKNSYQKNYTKLSSWWCLGWWLCPNCV